jgi:multidrug efflux pump subunit AcrB
MRLFLQAQQDVRIGGRFTRTQYQYTLQDANLEELNAWAPRVLERLKKAPELRDVASDQQTSGLQLDVIIDRDTAARLGVSPSAIDDALYDAFGQRQVATMYTQLNQYRVVLEALPSLQTGPDALKHIYVRSAFASGSGASGSSTSGTNGASGIAANGASGVAANGATASLVPLAAVARYKPNFTSLSVNHQGQFPSITISFNTAPQVALGQAVAAVGKIERELGLPPSVRAAFQGSAQAFGSSLANEPVLILAALVVVYIVLGMLYESYIHPITILSTLPSAGVGALLALILCKTEFSVIALIGIILLIGIVKKNAIMMIDFALELERDEGLLPRDSIYKACLLRFRPILMTTMAALLGGLPLALGSGVGSELRRPLGITIVGGLIISQLLTLFTTPVVYLALSRFSHRRTQPKSEPIPTRA